MPLHPTQYTTHHKHIAAPATLACPQSCCCCWVTSVVSDSVRPHRRQPTRLPRPWDSPGKNTGVGCHFLLQCVKVKSLSCVRLFATPWTAAYQAPRSMGFSSQCLFPSFPNSFLVTLSQFPLRKLPSSSLSSFVSESLILSLDCRHGPVI